MGLGLRFFEAPKLIEFNAPRNPLTGLAVDYACSNILDMGLPNLQLEVTNSVIGKKLINIASLTTENIILVFQPGALTPEILKTMPANWLKIPGTPGDEIEAINFNQWSNSFAYFAHSIYFVSHIPISLLHEAAVKMNLTGLNFISDPDFKFGKAWHLPIAKLTTDGTAFYERMTAVVPHQNGVAKVFSGITNPDTTAEKVLAHVIEKYEASKEILNNSNLRK